MSVLLPFLIVLLIVALFSRVDLFFYLLYILFGIVVLGRLWASRALKAVTIRRIHADRVFQGETVDVRLEVINRGWLPVLVHRLIVRPQSALRGYTAARVLTDLLQATPLDIGSLK